MRIKINISVILNIKFKKEFYNNNTIVIGQFIIINYYII